jgi:mannose-1-phosphate guanylyltransferase/mannose-6-phosphate isomerase
MNVIPVILSGGSGSRLWPLSRQDHPKQLLPVVNSTTLLQDTALRFREAAGYGQPLVICNEAHRFAIAEQLREIDVTARIILEPCGRNTAPAAAIAALHLAATDPDAVMVMVASDHVIANVAAFHTAVHTAAAAAARGYVVALGVAPTAPETGYGYIQQGGMLAEFSSGGVSQVSRIARFVEKPDLATAEQFIAAGDYFWNASIFVFRAETYLAELERLAPEMLAGCRKAYHDRTEDLDFLRLGRDAFTAVASDSIDYAVMEKTDRAAVVPADGLGWSDVGSWGALWEIAEHKDAAGNAILGQAITEASENCYIRTHDKQIIATVGVRDLVIVATKDAILVADRTKTQHVRAIVDRLQKSNRQEAIHHRMVYRPWGSYESLDDGDRFQVKRLVVKPGQKLSLQKHFHRAEHWVVVQGTAMVHRDGEEILLRENESVYLPLGCIHRLDNPGKIPLVLVEVQSGSYLGEDDIVRFADTYGRVGL